MKKFASLSVFRNVFFIFLVTCPATDFYSQNVPELFQSPIKKCWDTADNSINNIASDNDSIILSTQNGEIKRIENKSGNEIWKTSIGGKYDSIFRLQNEDIFLLSIDPLMTTENNLVIRKLDRQTGIVKELTKIGRTDSRINLENLKKIYISGESSDVGLLILIFQNIENFLKNIDKNKNIQISPYDNTSHVITDGHIVQQIFYNGKDPVQIHKIKKENQKISSITAVNNVLFWGDESGNFFEKSSTTDVPAKLLRTGGRISSIQNAGNNLLITSNDNFLYFYSLTKKRILWKKRLSGRIVISPKIETTFAVVITNAVSELLFIDLKDGKTFNQITLPDENFIKDFQIDNDAIFVLTNNGLFGFAENCQSNEKIF